MGINVSKLVERRLSSSPEFGAACDSVYDNCLDLAQHAFPGVRPYQLPDAAVRLNAALSSTLPLVRRWVPSPPGQAQVDSALRKIIPSPSPRDGGQKEDTEESLTRPQFKGFAIELFRDAVLSSAGTEVLLRRVPIGVAGIAGVGMAAGAGREVVGSVIGLYALGVAATVYFSFTTS